ncbi:hypothetical protein HanXRQr2_Chr07g0299841 [Helianthus annuus]|uniref:Uncharacterized protein n=1 Tax=Helianthus annuus TaxID=4232 RepID=A0A9K3NG48_HELAN|nr:hypothetical protein HanXRQr2_Chr07g0299841 [Helianthus annuus]KAJ0905116.1 hypothetical protein HanPSC8_Chr07g0290281 [Helianthus annuus]
MPIHHSGGNPINLGKPLCENRTHDPIYKPYPTPKIPLGYNVMGIPNTKILRGHFL